METTIDKNSVLSKAFLDKNHIELLSIEYKLNFECAECHRGWGFTVANLADVTKLPLGKFICGNCLVERNKKPISQLV